MTVDKRAAAMSLLVGRVEPVRISQEEFTKNDHHCQTNRGQMLMHGTPDNREVHAKVMVNEEVSHAPHIAPWNVWVCQYECNRYALGGIPQYLKHAIGRVLPDWL
jgi:hypothetical protein